VRLGGFAAAEDIYYSRDEAAGVDANFNTGVSSSEFVPLSEYVPRPLLLSSVQLKSLPWGSRRRHRTVGRGWQLALTQQPAGSIAPLRVVSRRSKRLRYFNPEPKCEVQAAALLSLIFPCFK
jgi:hypothetical protein